MRAGAKKFSNSNATELKVPKYIHYTLKQIGKVTDEMASVLNGTYHNDYYKGFGLGPAKKKAAKIFDDLEKLENMVKANKYYDRNATSSPMYK